jgi:hypothetical protein
MSSETLHQKCRETRLTAPSVLFYLCQDILMSRWWQNLYIRNRALVLQAEGLEFEFQSCQIKNYSCRTIPLKKIWQNYSFRQHFSRRATVLTSRCDWNINGVKKSINEDSLFESHALWNRICLIITVTTAISVFWQYHCWKPTVNQSWDLI